MYKLESKTVKGLSPLTINKTAENKMKVFPHGYTYQETRSGKNLLKITEKSATLNGLTFTINNDGSILVNGTATADTTFVFNSSFVLESDKSYYMSGCNGGSSTTYMFRMTDTTWTQNVYNFSDFTLYKPINADRVRATIQVKPNVTMSNVIFKPMISVEKDIPFEPYGAMPSPEYPSDIRNLGDNINLAQSSHGLWINSATAKFTTIADAYSFIAKVKPNTTYVISKKYKGNRFLVATSETIPENNTSYSRFVHASNHDLTEYKLTTQENEKYIFLGVYYGTNTEEIKQAIEEVKIEQGSTPTSYSEYGCGSVGVKVENKNIAKINESNWELTKNGIKNKAQNAGVILYECKVKKGQKVNLNLKLLSKPTRDTTLSGYINNVVNTSLQFLGLQQSNWQLNTIYTKTYIATEDCTISHKLWGNANSDIFEFQFWAEIDNVTNYVEHQEQNIIFPLSQGQVLHKGDYLAEDGIHQGRKTIVLTGNETTWTTRLGGTSSNIRLFEIYVPSYGFGNTSKNYSCFTHFTNNLDLTQKYTARVMNNILAIHYDETFTTVEQWKSYLAEQYANSTPVTVEYELAEEIVIPYTEEQEYVLNHIYSYEETTNIDIISEFGTEIDVEYTPQFLQEIKDKFIKGPTFGRIHILDTDENFTQDNYLKDFSVSELRFIPDKGLFGGCVAKKVDVNFNNVNKQFSIQDKEFEAYLGVDYEDERYEIKYGTFIVQHPETEDTTDNTSFTALDYMIKFNQKYIDYVTYPCTLRDIAESICIQAGVTLAEEKFRNDDFIVENNQFVNGENLRQVLQGIALSAFSWARVDENNELHFDLNQKEDIDIELTTEEYYNLSKDDYKYGPINRIIIRDSQIEGENVTIENKQLQGYPIGKNLLNFKNFTSQTINGLTITNNEDGSITLNGTTTDVVSIRISDVHNNLRNGKYYLSRNSSGTVEGGTFVTILYGRNNGTTTNIYGLSTEEVKATAQINYEEYYLWLYVAAERTFKNYILKPQLELGETKTNYEPFISSGICELVIEDNPFAYTQKKREQLIEAGKELFGFRYMPINDVSLIGLAFLNSKDKIRFKTLDGEVFDTYLFDHTINYNGVILDNVQSKALTKTETKYIYKPDITQAIKNTQIIVDKANQTINQIIEKQDEQSSQLVNIETDLSGVHTTIQDNQKDIEEKINEIEQTIEGTKQTLTYKGGNNIFYYAKEFWNNGTENGTPNLNEYTDTEIQQKSISGNGYIINKGTSEQKNVVKNDTYTISFTYKKLIDLATGYVDINGTRINLTSTSWKEEVITEIIDTNTIDIKIVSDTANAFKIFDLMGAIGNEKQVWTQNPNETRTDTVTIGKGIQVNSSTKNTYARFDADGNRIYNSSTNEVVTELTDKGVDTDKVTADVGQVGGILIQVIDGQTWFSSLL